MADLTNNLEKDKYEKDESGKWNSEHKTKLQNGYLDHDKYIKTKSEKGLIRKGTLGKTNSERNKHIGTNSTLNKQNLGKTALNKQRPKGQN